MAETDTDHSDGPDGPDSTDGTGSAGLSPMPEPRIEPGEPAPGGVDAIPDPSVRLTPDLGVNRNPAFEERAPQPIAEEVDDGEDTSTAATQSSGSDGGGDAEQQLETSE